MFSLAQEVAQFLDQRKRRRHACAIVYLAVLAGYMMWRPTIFNPELLGFSLLFYAADVFGALQGVFFIWNSWDVCRRGPPPSGFRPAVDVFVPVYSEPAEMIELTLIGAVGIDYPHQTFLLDDGRRPELREIAERHGARYVTRPDNKGAKAGNLNHALTLSSAEAVAVFDADHIPKREALDMLAGHLKDPKVAVAQAPQMFYNEDGFLYRDVIVGCVHWHEQCHFMHVAQGRRDFFGGSTCVGTGCVYRRSALDAIGGFPEATLTEDFHSSILFHQKGYDTVWVNEPVAWGVAAADISEFYKTRRRWTYGNLQAFARERVLLGRGLPLRHWLSYLSMTADLLAGWFQLIYVLVPILGMLTGLVPFQASAANIVLLVLVPAVMVAALNGACGGFVRFLPGQIFSMGKIFLQMECTRGLFGRKMKWQISLKNVLGSIHYGRLAPHIALLGGSLAAVLYTLLRALKLVPDVNPVPGGAPVVALASVWVLLNCWRSWRWIADSVRLTRRTHREYLFEAAVPVLDAAGRWIGSTTRLSTGQLEAVWHAGLVPPEPGSTLNLLIPGCCAGMTVQPGSTAGLLEVAPADAGTQAVLRRSLYSVDWHRMLKLSGHSFQARAQGLGGDWQAAVWLDDTAGAPAVPRWAQLLHAHSASATRKVLLRTPGLPDGSFIRLQTHDEGGCHLKKWRTLSQTIPSVPMPRGMNNDSFGFFEIALAEDTTDGQTRRVSNPTNP